MAMKKVKYEVFNTTTGEWEEDYTTQAEIDKAMEVFDDGGDDTSSPDAGGPGSTDMGFSTSQGGFIPKRKKKKSMKRGGLASRK